MVMRYGMDQKLGQVTYEAQHSALVEGLAQPRSYSEDTAREIDGAIRALVGNGFERAVGLLNKRRQDLERGAALLQNKETLAEDDLKAFTVNPPSNPSPSYSRVLSR